jgi:hypothetical protein
MVGAKKTSVNAKRKHKSCTLWKWMETILDGNYNEWRGSGWDLN